MKTEDKVNQLYNRTIFINSDCNWRFKLLEMLQASLYNAYLIYNELNEVEKNEVLNEQFEMDNDMGSYGDGKIETSIENLSIILDDAKNAE